MKHSQSCFRRPITSSYLFLFFVVEVLTQFLTSDNVVQALAREKLGKASVKSCAYVNGEVQRSPTETGSEFRTANEGQTIGKTSSQMESNRQNGKAWGKHGMLMFGGEKYLYASHLPMFHAPHDYQVIFRFHLRDQARQQQIMQALTQRAEVWTLDPIEFDLLRMSPEVDSPLREFQADVYRGHFERDGKLNFQSETVIIDKVLVFRQLHPQNTASDQRYFLFPDGGYWYAMKRIDVRPDLDVLLRLKVRIDSRQIVPCWLTIEKSGLEPPQEKSLRENFSTFGIRLLQAPQVVYRETGDLQ